jgi:hypothetical protein
LGWIRRAAAAAGEEEKDAAKKSNVFFHRYATEMASREQQRKFCGFSTISRSLFTIMTLLVLFSINGLQLNNAAVVRGIPTVN